MGEIELVSTHDLGVFFLYFIDLMSYLEANSVSSETGIGRVCLPIKDLVISELGLNQRQIDKRFFYWSEKIYFHEKPPVRYEEEPALAFIGSICFAVPILLPNHARSGQKRRRGTL